MSGLNVDNFVVKDTLYVENVQVLIENLLTSITLVINRLSQEESILGSIETVGNTNIHKITNKYFDDSVCLTSSLQHFIELQKALIDLTGPRGNVTGFSKRLRQYMSSKDSCNELLSELRLIQHLQ